MIAAEPVIIVVKGFIFIPQSAFASSSFSSSIGSEEEHGHGQMERDSHPYSSSSSSPSVDEGLDEIGSLALKEVVVDVPRDVARRWKRIYEDVAAHDQHSGAVGTSGDCDYDDDGDDYDDDDDDDDEENEDG